VASFGEGESHLHESVKMSSPIVPRVLPPPTARADCCGRLETWASLTPNSLLLWLFGAASAQQSARFVVRIGRLRIGRG
jgi:hypothetical protein